MVEDSSRAEARPVSSEASPPASRELVEALREWADVTAATDTEAQRQEDRLLEAWRSFQGSGTALANTPGWRDIETATDFERVMVAGWNPPTPGCAGYWWYHEDDIFEGRAVNHPEATLWCPLIIPPLPQPPEVK